MQTSIKHKVSVPYYVELEDLLLRQIGFVLKGKTTEIIKSFLSFNILAGVSIMRIEKQDAEWITF